MQSTSDFVLEQIRMRPDVTLEELRSRAALEGRRVREGTFYRARVDLGLDGGPALTPADPIEPSGAQAAASTTELGTVAPPESTAALSPAASGRARRRATDGSLTNLAAAIEDFLAERDRLREALTRMRAIVEEVLAR